MRMLIMVAGIVALLHMIAAVGFIGWLYSSDRLSGERVDAVQAMFSQTVEQQRQIEAEQHAKAEQLRQEAERMARLSSVGGLSSAAERLAHQRQQNEMLLRQLERTRREIESLQTNLHLARQRMERRAEELAASKAELERQLADMQARLNDEGFRRAVTLYEQLPAKQVKQMFADMLGAGDRDQVVAYLQAMQPRTAAKVLREFKAPEEIEQAVALTEALRSRGSDLAAEVEAAG